MKFEAANMNSQAKGKNSYSLLKLALKLLIVFGGVTLFYICSLVPLGLFNERILPGWYLQYGRFMKATPILVPLTITAMASYVIYFLSKRKRFRGEKRFSLPIFLVWVVFSISLFGTIGVIYTGFQAGTNLPPGLSVVGTMTSASNQNEIIQIKLCTSDEVQSNMFNFKSGPCDRDAATDLNGKYEFYNVPPGSYRIYYKRPEEDSWKLGRTLNDRHSVNVGSGVTRVDPIVAY